MVLNPFAITKASDFTDDQINLLWVSPGEKQFERLLAPSQKMPIVLFGGKGAGKTHLMRYYSYESQRLRIRGAKNLLEIERWLGIFVRCTGLNASRFRGKGVDQEVWDLLFAYYFDIWITQRVVSVILDLNSETIFESGEEQEVVRGLCDLFDRWEFAEVKTLASFLRRLGDIQKEIDFKVNNAVFRRGEPLEITILSTPGSLIFGIPKVVQRALSSFKEVTFLYLIDELESLEAEQQVFVNTLVREHEGGCSIRIGTRLYGLRTRRTLAAGEELKEGSEYEPIQLDELLRDSGSTYNRFARRLCLKRLHEAGFLRGENDEKTIDSFFEPRSFRQLSDELAKHIRDKYGDNPPHLEKLRRQLEERDILSSTDLEVAIDCLRCQGEPLLEKLNVLSFYRAWAKGAEVPKTLDKIRKQCRDYQKTKERKSSYGTSLQHFQDDLYAQLCRETGVKYRYYGFENFLQMTLGNPRNLLKILKQIYRWAEFRGTEPFRSGPIDRELQDQGVRETADWFFHDALGQGQFAERSRVGTERLAELFRQARYSDKPSESSLVTFSTNWSELREETRRCLEACCSSSFLYEVSAGQRDKNSYRVDCKYQLNPILSPRWDLPIARRGTIPLKPEDVDSLFAEDPSGYTRLLRERYHSLNAPFRPFERHSQLLLELKDDER